MLNPDADERSLPGRPDPVPETRLDRADKSLGSLVFDPVSGENEERHRPWRARRLDDDPRSAEAADHIASWLRVMVGRSAGSLLDAEEATQEAWLVLLTQGPLDEVGRDQDVLPARLAVILRHHLADLERRARRRTCQPLALEDAEALSGREDDPAVAYERGRLQTLVRAVLDEARLQLSEATYRIVVLRGIEGQGFAEIAEELGMPVARIYDRYRRAIAVVRDLLIRRLGSDLSGVLRIHLTAEPSDPEFQEVTP